MLKLIKAESPIVVAREMREMGSCSIVMKFQLHKTEKF